MTLKVAEPCLLRTKGQVGKPLRFLLAGVRWGLWLKLPAHFPVSSFLN